MRSFELIQRPPSGRPALSIGQGCPGPKFRDIGPYPAQQGLIAVHQCSRITSKAYQRSYVDARVAGSKGHYPAGAPTTFSRLAPLGAKSLGPPVDRSAALAQVTPEDRFAPTPLVNYSPTHFRHNCSSFSMYCTLFVWFVLACLRLRKRVWCRCTHRLLPGLYRRRRAVIGWQQSRLACAAGRLAAGLTKAKSSESRPRPACKPSAPPLLWVFKLLLFWFLIVSAHASRDAANHSHGPPAAPNLLHAYGCWAQRLSATRKRSFKRAQARVLRTGTTTYRGRLHNAASLALRPLPSVERSPPPQSRPVVPPTCQFLTWNVGGLNAARYQEVLAWLGQQRSTLHVLCVQETKWAQWSEYATPDWYVLNSGSGTSSGGVAFFVNRTFYTQESIKHSEVVPGRLFNLRLLGPTPLDMLGVYQYSWNPQNKAYRSPVTGGTSNPEAALLQQRAQIWLKIRSWTAAVPARHKLLIAGDLNACLQPQSPHVGTGTAVHQSLQHPDQDSFQQLVSSAGLVALNTWRKSGRTSGTYLMHQKGAVQIDFFLTRLPGSSIERQASALPDAPVVQPSGLRHIPVTCYLQLGQPAHRKPPHPTSSKHIADCLQRAPAMAEAFRAKLQFQLAVSPPAPGQLDDSIRQAWLRTTSASRQELAQSRKGGSACLCAAILPTLKSFWELRCTLEVVDGYWSPVVWHWG